MSISRSHRYHVSPRKTLEGLLAHPDRRARLEAQLAQARVDLDRTEIRAPVDGIVVKKSVEPGQTVAASLQAPELFVIAQDLRQMQVETSIDESEVGRIRVGQEANFTVDSFPGRTFRGNVAQIRKAAQVVQNVVTYIGVIRTSNPDLELFPGMTANVRVIVDTRQNVLKVPNAALRFRPTGVAPEPAGAAAAAGDTSAEDKGKGQGKGRGGQAFIERLTKELGLTPEQRVKIEAIQNETRAKIGEITTEEPAERRRQAERARAERRFNDVRQLSNALLTDIAPKIERLQGATEAREILGVSLGDRRGGRPRAPLASASASRARRVK